MQAALISSLNTRADGYAYSGAYVFAVVMLLYVCHAQAMERAVCLSHKFAQAHDFTYPFNTGIRNITGPHEGSVKRATIVGWQVRATFQTARAALNRDQVGPPYQLAVAASQHMQQPRSIRTGVRHKSDQPRELQAQLEEVGIRLMTGMQGESSSV
jgi:hypothetical protein